MPASDLIIDQRLAFYEFDVARAAESVNWSGYGWQGRHRPLKYYRVLCCVFYSGRLISAFLKSKFTNSLVVKGSKVALSFVNDTKPLSKCHVPK